MRFAILNLTRAVANDTKKTQQAPKNITPMSVKTVEISLNEKCFFMKTIPLDGEVSSSVPHNRWGQRLRDV